MYFDRHSIRRGTRSTSSSLFRCPMPPIRYLIVTILLFIILLYSSASIGRVWCDHEKDIISVQSNRQLELELTKLRQCIEEKASMHEKSNDLQWEVEKFKRSNADLQSDNEQLNLKLTTANYKLESSLQEIATLKVEIENLNEKHDNIQQAIHNHIGLDRNQPQIIEHNEPPMIEHISDPNSDTDTDQKILIEDNPFARNAVSLKSAKIGIAVVIFCYNRHSYLERTLESIFRLLPPTSFHIFISQQGYDKGVTEVIQKYSDAKKAYWLGFDYDELKDKQIKRGFEEKRWLVYHKISAHYKFAFEYLFDRLNYDKVISLEDDMEISPDFFSFFEVNGKLMDSDESIFCISAWNDYGQRGLVYDSKALYRTDIFPGLGWMFTQSLWNELGKDWPLTFWDDWLRESEQRKNRSCVRPEMNRVYTFGSDGSSEGQFWQKYLRGIELNKDEIDWSDEHEMLLNLSPSGNYDIYLRKMVEEAREVREMKEVLSLTEMAMPLDYAIRYSDLEDYTSKSKELNLMEDHKEGVPRQSYRGIVVVRWKNHRILFVPQHVDWSERTFA